MIRVTLSIFTSLASPKHWVRVDSHWILKTWYRIIKNSSQYHFSGRRQILKNLMLHWMKLLTFKSISILFLEMISILIFARFSKIWNAMQNRTMSKVDDVQNRRCQSFHGDYCCWTSVTLAFWHWPLTIIVLARDPHTAWFSYRFIGASVRLGGIFFIFYLVRCKILKNSWSWCGAKFFLVRTALASTGSGAWIPGLSEINTKTN